MAAMQAALVSGDASPFPRAVVDEEFPCKAWVCPAHTKSSFEWDRADFQSRRRLQRILGSRAKLEHSTILAELREQQQKLFNEVGRFVQGLPNVPVSAVWFSECDFGIAPMEALSRHLSRDVPLPSGGGSDRAAYLQPTKNPQISLGEADSPRL